MTGPSPAPTGPHNGESYSGANISAPFIQRPVATSLLMIAIHVIQQIQKDRSLACAEVQYLLDFIRTSQRGVILRRATRRAEEVLADE